MPKDLPFIRQAQITWRPIRNDTWNDGGFTPHCRDCFWTGQTKKGTPYPTGEAAYKALVTHKRKCPGYDRYASEEVLEAAYQIQENRLELKAGMKE
jgi:hypothetical protein